uniref:DUF7027 domain-containing protein n=1 Tax=Plectus sambesii TaxID=2011161 RepID=A0A914VKA2_9BILA
MIQVRPQFDPNDPKYRTCCGCPVMTGVKIAASFNTAGIIFIPILVIVVLGVHDELRGNVSVLAQYLGGLLIPILVLSCLWYGLIKEREGFLIPMLAFLIIVLIQLGIAVFVLLIWTLSMMYE